MAAPKLETQEQMAQEAVKVKRELTDNLPPQTMQRIEHQLDRALETYLADRQGVGLTAPEFRADLTAMLRSQFPELAEQAQKPKAEQQKAQAPATQTETRLNETGQQLVTWAERERREVQQYNAGKPEEQQRKENDYATQILDRKNDPAALESFIQQQTREYNLTTLGGVRLAEQEGDMTIYHDTVTREVQVPVKAAPKAPSRVEQAPAEAATVREKTAYVLGTVDMFSGPEKQNQVTVTTSLNEQDVEAAVRKANAALQGEFGDQYSAIMRGPNGDIFAKRALEDQGIEVTGGNAQNYMIAMDAIEHRDPSRTSEIRKA